jgi:peptide/nickel transport system substrate-binding protein
MRRIVWQLLAVSSLLLSGIAGAATRPQYGGTVHVMTRIAPKSLDPLDTTQSDTVARRSLTNLLFDTLVIIDDFGHIKPALALSWEAEPGNQRWRFWLRSGVNFNDGTPLTAALVAASLRSANPSWNVSGADDSIVIALPAPDLSLPAKLALARNAIAKRTAANVGGTGPFHVSNWQPGKTLALAANEEYWGGRPFLDFVQVEFNTTYSDQLVGLELNKADVVEIAPEQGKRAAMGGRRVISSEPLQLVAILFNRDRQSAEDGKLRNALALSIDRASIRKVLLQGTGEISGAILPNWMTGYGFIFPAEGNLDKAREQRIEVAQAPVWTITFDPADPITRLIAERVALNGRDAGIPIQTSNAGNVDLAIVRLQPSSVEPQTALSGICTALGLPLLDTDTGSADALYQAEITALQTQKIIPLFHLPVSYGLSTKVKGFDLKRDGSWRLSDTWVASETP